MVQFPATKVNGKENSASEPALCAKTAHSPFLNFAAHILPQSAKRSAITSASRLPESQLLPILLQLAQPSANQNQAVYQLAYQLANNLRQQKNSLGRSGLVQNLLQQYALSSQEGIALMCLAEALLRIPDKATRDSLIRDKISGGDWQSHIGQSSSLFVNAATWGLLVTGKLLGVASYW